VKFQSQIILDACYQFETDPPGVIIQPVLSIPTACKQQQ